MQNDILKATMMLIPMILSLSVHEYSHARAARWLNDPTAERMGRLTLNPVAHIDPVGTIVLPLLGFLFGGFIFGWAKPVPVNPLNFSRGMTMKKGMLLVALAGPASNFVLAVLGSLAFFFISKILGIYSEGLHTFFYIFITLNVILAFFNMLPIPPLDGGRILAGLLPDRFDDMIQSVERYGFILLIFLLFSGAMSVLFVPARWLTNFLLGWPSLLGF